MPDEKPLTKRNALLRKFDKAAEELDELLRTHPDLAVQDAQSASIRKETIARWKIVDDITRTSSHEECWFLLTTQFRSSRTFPLVDNFLQSIDLYDSVRHDAHIRYDGTTS